MSSTNKTVIAFDLYGTLLSAESIAKELAAHFGDEKAASIVALWRRYQLEYTWRMNSMGTFPFPFPFSRPTQSTHNFSSTPNSDHELIPCAPPCRNLQALLRHNAPVPPPRPRRIL